MPFTARPATPADAESIRRIYNDGIEDRVGTFETRPRTLDEVQAWFDGAHPIVVVEEHDAVRPPGAAAARGTRVGAPIVAFASTSRYLPRECYAGIAEFSVYVDRAVRGRGAGRVAMDGLIAAARDAGYWKLVSRVFVENVRSRTLLSKVGFREVGVYKRHARLDGIWRDVVIVERLIPENQPETAPPQ